MCTLQTLPDCRPDNPLVETVGKVAGFMVHILVPNPWGQQFSEPVFDGRFEVLDHRVVGGSHLKMIVRPIDGTDPVNAIAFKRIRQGRMPVNGRSYRFVGGSRLS
ncbi:MAG: hypothetical protein IIB78_12465 [Proteobacteria bacterium]|nr:hypothetical protein [Pseudomonadota bacterium]